jgi:NAD(P)-dependent dehydrogenase (short-subunit alcohol dehydrogenase family)
MSEEFVRIPFGAASTAAEVIAGIDLAGKRAIVTGGASGIGVETARALASAGAEVTPAVRNVEAGQHAAIDIIASTGNTSVPVAPLDLADRSSIAAFVASWSGPLHILVNNAGIMASPEMRTPEGWELQFATNHLGHFALTTGPARRSGRRRGRSRPWALTASTCFRLGAGVMPADRGSGVSLIK